MTIKAVFFDLHNTLARFDPPPVEVQLAVCRELGIPVSPEGIAKGYALADDFMAQEEAAHPLIQRNREERRSFFGQYERLVLQGAGVELSPEKALDVFRRVQRRPLDLALFEDVRPALEALLASKKTLGLITNINLGLAGDDRGIQEITARLGLDRYLRFAVTSQEIGASKPHPPIFLAALQRAGVQPHEALHVGDQYRSDIVGALGVGIGAVLLDRASMHADFQECPRITSLSELPALVTQLDKG